MHPAAAQAILEDRKIAYAITDRDLKVAEVNGATKVFGNHGETWLGQPLLDVVPELLGSEGALAEMLAGVLPRYELPWVNRELADGQTAFLGMVDLPCIDEAGQISGIVHVIQDLTEMGRLEQRIMQQRNELRLLQNELHRHNVELSAANAELKRLDELKSAFVSIAAHELRTPLTSIIGYLEMLMDGDAGALTDRQTDYLNIIDGSARRLLHITSDLLDLTRIETGRLELILQPTDLAALVEAAATEQVPQLEEKGQRLVLRAPLPLPLALCDPNRAAQIIGNLLSNASKYSPEGSTITISLSAAAEENYVQVAVADEGVGIADEDQGRLFSPFFRAGRRPHSGAMGAGLGLYITRSLTELHGGEIWLESTPGQGSTFYVTLPVASQPVPAEPNSPHADPNPPR